MLETIQIMPERDRRRQRKARIYPDPGVPVLMWAMDEARYFLSDGEWHKLEDLLSIPIITESIVTRMEEQQELFVITREGQRYCCQTRNGFDIYHCFVCGRSLNSVLTRFQDVPSDTHPYSLQKTPRK